MEVALHARSIKATLAPLVEVIVACSTCLVLWYGARLVLAGTLSAGSFLVFLLYLGEDVQAHARAIKDDRHFFESGSRV